jgi:hypothetical protein
MYHGLVVVLALPVSILWIPLKFQQESYMYVVQMGECRYYSGSTGHIYNCLKSEGDFHQIYKLASSAQG